MGLKADQNRWNTITAVPTRVTKKQDLIFDIVEIAIVFIVFGILFPFKGNIQLYLIIASLVALKVFDTVVYNGIFSYRLIIIKLLKRFNIIK